VTAPRIERDAWAQERAELPAQIAAWHETLTATPADDTDRRECGPQDTVGQSRQPVLSPGDAEDLSQEDPFEVPHRRSSCGVEATCCGIRDEVHRVTWPATSLRLN
jgi:hypothetical protein